VPVAAPVVVGANTALMVQLAPAATDEQLSVSVKFALGVMVKAIAAELLLTTVKVLAGLTDPTATLPKARLVGLTLTGAIPVPVTATESGLPVPL